MCGGRRFFVNGQKIYVTGGNYINSNLVNYLSPERYRDEVRFHAEMNLRMIRVWGGALVERPEFYNACDEFGIMNLQDLWGQCGVAMALWGGPARWIPESVVGNIPIIMIYLSPPWKIK